MGLSLMRLALIPIWGGALWGSLQIHALDLQLGHGICGPWGCGPPLEALIGFHAFWLSLILPFAICIGWFLPTTVVRRIGLSVLLAGCIGAVGLVGWDVVTYAMKSESTEYLLQRGLFTLATTVDIPTMQTTLAGAVLAFWMGREFKREDECQQGS